MKTFFHRPFSILVSVLAIGSFFFAPLGYTQSNDRYQRETREQIKVFYQGNELGIYHTGPALDKSYFHPLWTPDRRNVTYDAPADHIHHRGLCVGWPDVSGTDFWAEIISKPGKRGKIYPTDIKVETPKNDTTCIIETNEWRTEKGDVLVKGIYNWTFLPPVGNLQRLDLDMQLTAAAEKVIFGSDPTPREYHGLTIRIGPFQEPRYFNSEGGEGKEGCKGKPAKWLAVSGLQHGQPVLTAILDSPKNDCHPTKFYVQDQGMQFISSSPNYGTPKILKKGETWRLQYRVLAAGAAPEGQQWNLDKLWNEFAASLK